MAMENYSLADIAAANGNGIGGGNSIWLIILFVLLLGGGFNRTGEFGQYATAASQNEILLGQQFAGLNDRIDRGFTNIGNGISSATYDLNNRVTTEGRALSTQITDQTQKILDAISTNRMADMQNQINQLQLQNAVAGVVRYPMASTYNSGANPFCACGNGCGNF